MSNFGLFQFLCDFFSTIIPYCYVISRFFCTISENILERYSESILCIEAMQLGEERKSVDRMWIFVIVVIPPNFRKKIKTYYIHYRIFCAKFDPHQAAHYIV